MLSGLRYLQEPKERLSLSFPKVFFYSPNTVKYETLLLHLFHLFFRSLYKNKEEDDCEMLPVIVDAVLCMCGTSSMDGLKGRYVWF